jgi:hypothetical protein
MMATVCGWEMVVEDGNVLLVVLDGVSCEDPEIEKRVLAASAAGKQVRAMVSESTRMPEFFRQVDDLIVGYFRPGDMASFQEALEGLVDRHFAQRGPIAGWLGSIPGSED